MSYHFLTAEFLRRVRCPKNCLVYSHPSAKKNDALCGDPEQMGEFVKLEKKQKNSLEKQIDDILSSSPEKRKQQILLPFVKWEMVTLNYLLSLSDFPKTIDFSSKAPINKIEKKAHNEHLCRGVLGFTHKALVVFTMQSFKSSEKKEFKKETEVNKKTKTETEDLTFEKEIEEEKGYNKDFDSPFLSCDFISLVDHSALCTFEKKMLLIAFFRCHDFCAENYQINVCHLSASFLASTSIMERLIQRIGNVVSEEPIRKVMNELLANKYIIEAIGEQMVGFLQILNGTANSMFFDSY
jgi:hypothetical protein